ncbi:MAG: hypothetical protein ACRCYP_07810 [Alphaproteobacteria bacterium]
MLRGILVFSFFFTRVLVEGFAVPPKDSLSSNEDLPNQISVNTKTLEMIRQKTEQGEAPCLLIGRQAHETLPPIPEGSKEFWISSDIATPKGSALQNRLHLWGNFSDDTFCSRFNGLFSRVVVDMSTWKFFADDNSDPATRFSKLLKKETTSTFIFEATLQSSICNETQEPIYTLYNYSEPNHWTQSDLRNRLFQEFESFEPEHLAIAKQTVADYITQRDNYSDSVPPNEIFEEDYVRYKLETEYPEEIESVKLLHANAERHLRDITKNHLRTLFHEVELVNNGAYYDAFSNYPTLRDYYVCKNPI